MLTSGTLAPLPRCMHARHCAPCTAHTHSSVRQTMALLCAWCGEAATELSFSSLSLTSLHVCVYVCVCSLATELSLAFPVQLENTHVIRPQQVQRSCMHGHVSKS